MHVRNSGILLVVFQMRYTSTVNKTKKKFRSVVCIFVPGVERKIEYRKEELTFLGNSIFVSYSRSDSVHRITEY